MTGENEAAIGDSPTVAALRSMWEARSDAESIEAGVEYLDAVLGPVLGDGLAHDLVGGVVDLVGGMG